MKKDNEDTKKLVNEVRDAIQETNDARPTKILEDELYPTEEELRLISGWDLFDFAGLMRYIKERWTFAKSGWSERVEKGDNYFRGKPVRVFSISTGGWSGNEDIIEAMQANTMIWHMFWWESRRGGHYIFKIGLEEWKEE